jgi:hypothetical protein
MLVSLCRIMSAGSPQRRVRQRTVGDRAALQAKIIDRTVIAEWNVVRSDPPHYSDIPLGISSHMRLYGIHQVGQTVLRQPSGGAG